MGGTYQLLYIWKLPPPPRGLHYLCSYQPRLFVLSHQHVSSLHALSLLMNLFTFFQTEPLNDEYDIDADILNSMTSLGCFKDKVQLIERLLSQE